MHSTARRTDSHWSSDRLFDVPQTRIEPNPCVALYGPGPEGKRCRSCSLLLLRDNGNRRWYKCFYRRAGYDVRKMGAASTDHRVSWNACGRYREKEVH